MPSQVQTCHLTALHLRCPTHSQVPPQRPLVLHHCYKNREGPPQGPLQSSLGRQILRLFPRGVPRGSSGGTWSKSSAQCKDSPYAPCSLLHALNLQHPNPNAPGPKAHAPAPYLVPRAVLNQRIFFKPGTALKTPPPHRIANRRQWNCWQLQATFCSSNHQLPTTVPEPANACSDMPTAIGDG